MLPPSTNNQSQASGHGCFPSHVWTLCSFYVPLSSFPLACSPLDIQLPDDASLHRGDDLRRHVSSAATGELICTEGPSFYNNKKKKYPTNFHEHYVTEADKGYTCSCPLPLLRHVITGWRSVKSSKKLNQRVQLKRAGQ